MELVVGRAVGRFGVVMIVGVIKTTVASGIVLVATVTTELVAVVVSHPLHVLSHSPIKSSHKPFAKIR